MNINIQDKILISKIDKLFNANRPECIVDNPKCCLESIDNGGIDACFYLAELYEKQKISKIII